jgi:hypothetical protein
MADASNFAWLNCAVERVLCVGLSIEDFESIANMVQTFVHVLLFRCPRCGLPLTATSVSEKYGSQPNLLAEALTLSLCLPPNEKTDFWL